MIRKLLFFALCLIAATDVNAKGAADAPETETFYIQLESRARPGGAAAESFAQLNAGRELGALTGASDGFMAALRKRRYPSLIDGLNSLAVNGWRLSEAYSYTSGGLTTVVWVLQKSVANRGELLDGLADD